jgi:hypothetical protein
MIKAKLLEEFILLLWLMFLIPIKKSFKDMISKGPGMADKIMTLTLMLQKKILIF